MTLDALIMLAGVFVAAMPFLGFPPSWDTWIFFLLGVLVVGCGIAVRRRLTHVPHVPDAQFNPSEPLESGEAA